MIAAGDYLQPTRLEAALAELARARCTVVAGGTDIYPACVGVDPPTPLLDVSLLAETRGIEQGTETSPLRVGALTTWSDLVRKPLPRHVRALAQAAREVGGVQIQNRGTIGGNLCNASPAADGIPPLLALDATVELASQRGRRTLLLEQFVLGNRKTALGADELLTAIVIPPRSANAVSVFLKLGHRRYLVISIVMVAVVLDFDAQGYVVYCGIAVGACSAAARRLAPLERGLVGVHRRELPARATTLFDAGALAALAPIDDVRATGTYRLDAARSLIERGLGELAHEAGA
ncbi:MAG TPA: FAD binding domain-containing protein [Burkholderiaceae bacterium]|nr:FAD binding domain-containing protein [Burkholderiaceae bacterium]